MASRISRILPIVLLAVFLVLLGTYWLLLRGITIESAHIGGFELKRLYLKLSNDKLVLKARRVVIPRAKKRSSSTKEGLQKSLLRITELLRYVDTLDLQEVRFTNDRYRILYADRIFYLTNERYELAARVRPAKGGVFLEVPLFYDRSRDLGLNGKLLYTFAGSRIDFSGAYRLKGITGACDFHLRDGRLRFHLESNATRSLDPLLQAFPLNRVAKLWLSERLRARTYRLDRLDGEVTIGSDGSLRPDFSTLRGRAILQNATIRFDPELLPIDAERVVVRLKGGDLYFLPKHPRYGDHPVDGSTVALLHLDRIEALTLLLRIRYRGRLDWPIVRIWLRYGVPLRLGQRSGRVEARVDVDVGLGSRPHRVRSRGAISFSKGELEYGLKRWKVGGGKVTFAGKRIRLERVELREPWFDGSIDGELRLAQRGGKLRVHSRQIALPPMKPWLRLGKRNFTIDLRWDDAVRTLNIPKLGLTIVMDRKGIERLEARKLHLLAGGFQGVLRIVSDGSIRAVRAKGGYRAQGTVRWRESPFEQEGKPFDRMAFGAFLSDTGVSFSEKGGRFAFDTRRRTLTLRRLLVDVKRLGAVVRDYLGGTSGGGGGSWTARGESVKVRYGAITLPFDRFILRTRRGGFSFEGTLGKDRLTLVKNGKTIVLEARGISDRWIRSIGAFAGLHGGSYDFRFEGQPGGSLKGHLKIKGAVLRDLKAYNDMIALFNTIPALASLSDPGFSRKGFVIRKGHIDFRIRGSRLDLDEIVLDGRSSTIVGKGRVGLDSKALDVELAVRTARELGKTLGSIPVVGYILFGKDKSLTVGVKITGTMDKPKVKTHPVAEALIYPLELIRRTLTAPAVLVAPGAVPGVERNATRKPPRAPGDILRERSRTPAMKQPPHTTPSKKPTSPSASPSGIKPGDILRERPLTPPAKRPTSGSASPSGPSLEEIF
ncbi:YhdP family protein [Nitratifractor sp.]